MPAIPNVASVGVAIVPNMSGFGRQLAAGLPGIIGPALSGIAGIGGAVGGIIGAAVKEFVPLEATFARMVGLAGVAEEEIAGLTDAVLEMAPAVGKAPQELADALMFIVSSGFQGAAALEVLDASARAGAAGLGEVAVIADAVTSAINAYGPDVLSASRATDVLVAAVREGKIEANQFAPVLGKLLPTASAMGIAFEDVAGILAAMSRTGFDAAEASTALGAVMSTLLKPSKGAADTLADAGLSMAELRDIAGEPGGLVEVMRILDGALGDNEEALSTVVPNVRAFRGIMNLLAQDSAVVDDILAGVAHSVGATDDAFAAVADTAEFKLGQAMATLKNRLIEVGGEAAPQVVQAVEAIIPALEAVITGALDFATGVKVIGEFLAGLEGPAKGAATALGAVGLALALSTLNPIILALAGVAAAIVAIGAASREHDQDVKDLADALRDAGEQADLAAEAFLRQQLIEDGAAESARDLGLTLNDIVEAILGEEDAIYRVNNALSAADRAHGQNEQAIFDVRAAVADYTVVLGDARQALIDDQNATHDANEATRLLGFQKRILSESAGAAADELERGGDAAAGAIDPTEELAEDVKTLADNLKEAGDNQALLADALLQATDPLFNAVSQYNNLTDLLERVNEETDTEPAGLLNAKEIFEVGEAVLRSNAAFEGLERNLGGVDDALDVLAGLFGTTREDIEGELAALGITIDRVTGEISFALSNGIVVDGLAERLGRDINAEIAAAVNLVKRKYQIESPSKVFERQLGVPLAEGVLEPMKVLGRDLQAAISSAIAQSTNQSIPRGTATAPVAAGGDTITFDIDVNNPLPERTSESLQSAPLRMTLQGLVRR